MRSNWRLVKELLMRRNGNESVNFVAGCFSYALNAGYKFHVFFPQILVFFFHVDEKWGPISCTHQSVWGAKNTLQLRYTSFPAMTDLSRFEIWQVFLHENLCYVSITMHECVQIGVRLKNCS